MKYNNKITAFLNLQRSGSHLACLIFNERKCFSIHVQYEILLLFTRLSRRISYGDRGNIIRGSISLY